MESKYLFYCLTTVYFKKDPCEEWELWTKEVQTYT
jgi:hypothetical protein